MHKIQRKGKHSSKKTTLIHTIGLFIFPPNIVQKMKLVLNSSHESYFLLIGNHQNKFRVNWKCTLEKTEESIMNGQYLNTDDKIGHTRHMYRTKTNKAKQYTTKHRKIKI